MIEGTASAENKSNMSLTRKFEGCVESMFKVMEWDRKSLVREISYIRSTKNCQAIARSEHHVSGQVRPSWTLVHPSC